MGLELDPSWFAHDFDDSKEDLLSSVSSLIDLCARKLISDVCLLQNVPVLPRAVFSLLLMKAIEQKRTLSVSQLLKYYPLEDFVLPVPYSLTSWIKLFSLKFDDIVQEIKNLRERARIIISALSAFISQDIQISKLCMIDFGDLPMDASFGKDVCSLISNQARRQHVMMMQYTLKIKFTFMENDDVLNLIRVKTEKYSNIKLAVTGVTLYNNRFKEPLLLQLLKNLENSDLLLFSLYFADISPSLESSLGYLQKFKNLKVLSFTYLFLDFRSNLHLLDALAWTLYELVNLSCLSLHGCNLSGCLKVLFQKFCDCYDINVKKLKTDSSCKCCLLHRGALQYIDLCACELTSEDLMCLKEYPLAETLKYLNISFNKFDLRSLSSCLEAMSNSLVVLYMNQCIPKNSLLHPFFPKLSMMMKLKCLSMLGLNGDMKCLESLAHELKNMPNLQQLALSVPSDEHFQRNTIDNIKWFENIITGSKCIKITWQGSLIE